MCLTLTCAALLLQFASSHANEFVAITEVLKNPDGTEASMPGGRSHEFVEIANLGSDTLMTDSLFISDGRDADSVIAWVDSHGIHPNCVSGSRVVPPGRVAVILDPEYDSAVGLVPSSVHAFADSTILLCVGDAHIGDYSDLAESDGVYVYKGTAVHVSRVLAFAADHGQAVPPDTGKLYHRSPGSQPDGVSVVLQSVLFGWPEYVPCASGTSPGRFERLDKGWLVEWKLGVDTDTTVQCSLAAHKVGAGGGGLAGLAVLSTDGSNRERPIAVLTQDSARGVLLLTSIPLDSVVYRFVVTDGATAAGRDIDITTVWVPAGAIAISELFPRAANGVPEWFEIMNTSAMPINLRGWLFGDNEDSASITSTDLLVEPGDFQVVTSNREALAAVYPTLTTVVEPANWHTLNNYSDSLVLWDGHGQRREVVFYDHDWFGAWSRGSLERVSYEREGTTSSAWAVASQPSPGRPNVAASWRCTTVPELDIGPLPFTPNGDGRDDQLSIRVQLPAGAKLRLSVYSFEGGKVRVFTGSPVQQYLWDGRTDSGGPAPVGPFFVIGGVETSSGVRTMRKKGILWR
jgi:hypothetical protein